MSFSYYELMIEFPSSALPSTGYVEGGITYICDSRERAEQLLRTEVEAMTTVERVNYKATITKRRITA